MAEAVIFALANQLADNLYNIGSWKDLTALIQRIVGYQGEIKRDSSKLDGTPRKLREVLNRAATIACPDFSGT